MRNSANRDSVFQLSLTELAFVLTFIVLLLVGSRFVFVSGSERSCNEKLIDCQQSLTTCSAKNETFADCQSSLNSCNVDKENCYALVTSIVQGDPKKLIDTLIDAPKLREENARLKNELLAKEAELEAIKYLKETPRNPVQTRKALEFLAGYEEAAKRTVPNDSPRAFAQELYKNLEKCRGQLDHCVTVTGRKSGYGHPPCWTTPAGTRTRAQYLFNVEIREDGLRVTRAWPDQRNTEAGELPNVVEILKRQDLSLADFQNLSLPIFNVSKQANPECRHYVVLERSKSITNLDKFNRLRLGVEQHFYKDDRTGVPSR